MTPLEAVAQYIGQQPKGARYCVAYSGGLDSHVLLFLMAHIRQTETTIKLRAVHVDHGLQAGSASWADHARQVCAGLSIPLDVCQAEVNTQGHGPEAGARLARYAQFADRLSEGEHLLLAQHAEDQAETFLLQALRGSGPDGLAGIPCKRVFSQGYMGRPLLSCSQESLQAVAHENSLDWIEDPSNESQHFDRNFLRLKVMPLLKSRWPASVQTLGRAAKRSAAAGKTLMSLAQQDLQSVRIPGTTELSISALQDLPTERAFTALRLLVRQRGWRMPRLQDLIQVKNNLLDARPDSSGLVNAREYVFRRHKDRLYLLPQQAAQVSFHYVWQPPFNSLTIQETGLTLSVALCRELGIQLPESGDITVKSRAGGELIKLGNPVFHKAVKKILQESSVPPWVRDTIPLLYIDGKLAAVWGIVVAVDCRILANSGVEEGRNDAAGEATDRVPTIHPPV